jgi:hypothetical protein
MVDIFKHIASDEALRFGSPGADTSASIKPSQKDDVTPMNKLLKRGVLGVAALTVPVSAAVALPMAAHASTTTTINTVKAFTSTIDHPDTTSVAGTGTLSTPGGPQWAYDRLNLTLTAVRDSANTWSVTINAHGLYEAIADPTTGNIYEGYGNVTGWLNYEVSSPNMPSAKNLSPAPEAPDVTQSDMVTQLFNGNATIIGGGHYSYTYTGFPNNATYPGSIYTQAG